jgi:uncharacterized membrane protein
MRLLGIRLLALSCGALASGCSGADGADANPPAEASCPRDLPSDMGCPDAAPSYASVVAPILEQRCQGCHYPQNPFSSVVLNEYERVLAARRTALTLVYSCSMPPAEGMPLLAEERQVLMKWLVCGAPQN